MDSPFIVSSNDGNGEEEDQLSIFLISCSADGSVDRIVGSWYRSMKGEQRRREKKIQKK
jgi:hypothetical protein